MICPGVAGVRSVKWIRKIYLSDEEAPSTFQKCDYKGFHSSMDWKHVNIAGLFTM
jgi:sulfite oxidase